MTKIIINGAQGKMGRLACQTLEQHTDFHVVARLSRHDDLAQAIKQTQPDIVVDFTNAHSVYQNCLTIIEHQVHPVIGTTGLVTNQIEQLQQQCAAYHLGGLIVPNFSIAAILMMHLSAIAATLLPHVEIIEGHHPQKLDSPSGTALKTADLIHQAQQIHAKTPSSATHPNLNHTGGPSSPPTDTRDTIVHGIPIHSLRLPGLLAQQQVIFGNTGETLEIKHVTLDRACFMPGLVLACQKVLTLDTLIYGLETLILDFSHF